jgi:hypothetical protein
MRASLTAVVVLIAPLFVVGCSQSTSPTVPSSALAASAPASAQLGPGASYDPTGLWHFVTTINGNLDSTFDSNASQDSDGNLHFVDDEGEPITLERLGTGVIITYSLSVTSAESGCDAVRVRALARLDTRTNTITIPLRLTGCSQTGEIVVTGTKLS